MLRNSKELAGYRVEAFGGDVGTVDSFYFDDEYWTIRYLSVDASSMLPGRRVLISPISLGGINAPEKVIQVTETREEILGSPLLPSDAPISREYENRFFSYYAWPAYWGEMGRWGAGTHPSYLVRQKTEAGEDIPKTVRRESELRNSDEIETFTVEAAGGTAGAVKGLLFDDDTWAIRYLIVDVPSSAGAKKVLIPPHWVERAAWGIKTLTTSLSLDKIRTAPVFDPAQLPDEEYEGALMRHYRRDIEIDPARAARRTVE